MIFHHGKQEILWIDNMQAGKQTTDEPIQTPVTHL
jgi:hypothetical protein